MKCADAHAAVFAYVDGELAPPDRDSFEKHARACEVCARLVQKEAHWKAAVRVALPRPALPEGLRDRLQAKLDAEPAPRRRLGGPLPPHRTWRYLPLAAAAAAALIVVSVRGRSPVLQTAQSLFRADAPPDIADCDKAASWLRNKVGFPVRAPMLAGYRCRGGRLVSVGDRLAANLVYEGPSGRLVNLLVYDASGETLRAPETVHFSGRDVVVDRGPGVNSAAVREPGGLGFVATGDMNRDSLIQFVSHAAGQ